MSHLFRPAVVPHFPVFCAAILSLQVVACGGGSDGQAAGKAASSGGAGGNGSGSGGAGGNGSGSGGAGGAGAGTGGNTASGGGGTPNGDGTAGGGGTASSGGASGGGGGTGGRQQVAACPAGTGSAGEWQDITPAAFRSPPNLEATCIAVNPVDFTVFASASNVTNGGACPTGTECPHGGTGVYKSTDCGATWSKVSVTPELDTGACFGLIVDPVDPRTMFYNNGYGDKPTVWKSVNGGVDWEPLETASPSVVPGGFVNSTSMDPENPKHLVVTYHVDCVAPRARVCLSETLDGGETWRQFDGPETGGWVEGNHITVLGATNWLYTSANGGWFTGDSGATWKLAVCWQGNATGCAEINGGVRPAVLLSDGAAYLGALNTGLFVSHARLTALPPVLLGQTWERVEGAPQASDIGDDGTSIYTSVDTRDGQPFSTAKFSDASRWTRMASIPVSRGATMNAHDSAHHLFYSANSGAGLFRLVTP
jgi:hypothetical protein